MHPSSEQSAAEQSPCPACVAGEKGKRRRRKRTLCAIYAGYLILLAAIAYSVTVVYRSRWLYTYIKSRETIITESIFRADAVLGFAPRPGASGHMMFKEPPSIPYQYDQHGCRVCARSTDSRPEGPVFLALGCSFTHGDACFAEAIYPALVARHFGGTVHNRGFCAYGLSQMLLIARDMIPRLKPDYVLCQDSPWLAGRSLAHFASTDSVKRPQPFFHIDRNGHIALHPPVFQAYMTETPAAKYWGHPATLSEFCAFVLRTGWPVYVSEDLGVGGYKLKCLLGLVPEPTRDLTGISHAAYTEISQLCRESDSKLLICFLGSPMLLHAIDVPEPVSSLPGALVVDTWRPLISRLPDYDASEWPSFNEETYLREYGHYRGDPPVFVDGHPNAKAHRIIADTIISRIAAAQASEGR